MSIVINSNMTASRSALNMSRANDLLKKSMLRLSSGKRIINPADDAGGLAVGMKLQSALRRTAATKQNIQNGVSYLQVQDGALKVTGNVLDRMAELKSYYNDISKNASDRQNYNYEFQELQSQLAELRRAMFNGVSLFATYEPDNNPMKIITTEDGLTGKVDLKRTGLFENLKSKFGADSILNSGSHGKFRQLVGNFTKAGGTQDPLPGKTSRAHKIGELVYKNRTDKADSESGYFMALTNVRSGSVIEDTGKASSKWIRLADKTGKGFVEAFPEAPEHDAFSLKYSSNGNKMSYLKGDVVKVPAHWSSPGSYLYLKAQSDVPYGKTLSEVLENHVGDGKYFEYVGQDRSGGATTDDKPTTDYVRANANMAEPSIYTAGVDGTALVDLMKSHDLDNYTPGHVKVGNDVYVASHDWEVKKWESDYPFKAGEVILDETNNEVIELTDAVKGEYLGNAAVAGDYVLDISSEKWYKATTAIAKGASGPVDPSSVTTVHAATDAYTHKQEVKDGSGVIYTATNANMKGVYNPTLGSAVAKDDVVVDSVDGKWYEIGALPSSFAVTGNYSSGDTVEYLGSYYKAKNAQDGSGTPLATTPDTDATNWTLAEASDLGTDVDAAVDNLANKTYWTENDWTYVANPETDSNFGVKITDDLKDVTNANYWSKTHFGSLIGKTVSTNYERGDNIYYKGKHYVYTSNLLSNDSTYVNPTDDSYTEIEDLIRLGAVTEVTAYVDTTGGGGGSGMPTDVYYRPNQDLAYVDRLPNAGTVRTNTITRRTDSPTPPGDDIYNSADDMFHSGLDAGNDGIYGTADDFYASTTDKSVAMAGYHVDADADNNKDLLNGDYDLSNFSVADFVDYIQTLANFRAVNGGTMSRLGYAEQMLEENAINLEAATSRIMDADMAAEATKLARQNVLVQAGASMVVQANQLANIALSLLQ